MKKILLFLFSIAALQLSCQVKQPSLVTVVHTPTELSAKPPVLVLLHGMGSNENDLLALASGLPQNFLILSLRAPIERSKGSYVWYNVDFSSGKPVIDVEQEKASREMVINYLKEMHQYFEFDENHVYLGGFSQGAIMSYAVGLRHPELVNGIICMSGRMLPDIKTEVASKEKLSGLRVFVSHGLEDRMLGVEGAREAVDWMRTQGLSPFYREYPIAHSISPAVEADLSSWLKADK